jgi:ascorbate-specific PTS system EIIC-type component UlaA
MIFFAGGTHGYWIDRGGTGKGTTIPWLKGVLESWMIHWLVFLFEG